ncbi:24518_t:CDS:2, partial [Racocetra persica]
KATRIMLEESEEESKPENKSENVIFEVDDVNILTENLLVKTNSEVQELIINYEFDEEDNVEAKDNNDKEPSSLFL